jgi:RNA polymerase sigma-70 factor (ECF subfamily)
MKRFLTNEWRRDMAQKRGAGKQPLALDSAEAEHRFAAEPPLAPDELYERRWAMTLLDEALRLIVNHPAWAQRVSPQWRRD